MVRAEFLEVLKNQLAGQMPEGKVDAHIRYYQDYIQSQTRLGKEEQSVLNDLGDPRLIAKTLIDTAAQAGQLSEDSQEYCSEDRVEYTEELEHTFTKKKYKLDLSTWYGKLIVILVAAAIIFMLITLLTVAIPFVCIAFLILYGYSWWKKNK